MAYVLDAGGQATLTLDDDTRKVWTLAIGYQEINP